MTHITQTLTAAQESELVAQGWVAPAPVPVPVPAPAPVPTASPALLPGCTFFTDFTDPALFGPPHVFASKMDPTLLARITQVPGGGVQNAWPAGSADGGVAWVTTLNPTWTLQTQGIGTTPYWFQFEYQVPASRLARSVDGGGGFKLFILGGYIPGNNYISSASDINNEFVVTNSGYRGFPMAYMHGMNASGGWDGTYNNLSTPFVSQYSSVDFLVQNAINRAGAVDQAHQYCLYSQTKGASPPNPLNPGAFAFVPDERMLVKCRVHYGTYGVGSGPSNEVDVWCKHPGDAAWTLVISGRGFPVPFDPAYPGGPNGLWLTSYDTGAGVYSADTYARYYNLWIGTQDPSPTGTVLPPLAPPPVIAPASGSVAATFYTAQPSATIKNVSRNTVSSVDPCPAGGCAWSGVTQQRGLFNDTGVVYMPLMGALGSIVFCGGGHNDYFGNEVYGFDLSTQLVSRLTDPWPTLYRDPVAVANQSTLTVQEYWRLYHAHQQTGELWVDGTFPPLGTGDGYPAPVGNKATMPDQPCASHMYGYQVYLPPGFGHSDPLGALLTTCRPSLTPIGSAAGKQDHILPMTPAADGKRHWARFSSNLMTQSNGLSGAMLDKKRNIVLSHTYNNGFDIIDLTAKTRRLQAIAGGPSTDPGCGTWMHDEVRDLYVYFRGPAGGGPLTLWVVDPVTFKLTVCALTGGIPSATITQGGVSGTTYGGSTWVAPLGGLVYYAGDGGMTAYSVIPSGDPRTAPWTITAMPFSGDQPAIQLSAFQSFHMARFNYIDALDGFLWTATTAAPIQFWKR